MADETPSNRGTIAVTYITDPPPPNGYPFTFAPLTLPLKKDCDSYEVTFTFSSNIAGAKLVGDTFHGDVMPQHPHTIEIENGGLRVTFGRPSDPFKESMYHYLVTVDLGNNQTVTSHDPEIEIPAGP